MLMRERKTKNNKTKAPLRFERRAQSSHEVSGDHYIWYRYKLIREHLAFKKLLDPETVSPR
jgi:hypothetical protein